MIFTHKNLNEIEEVMIEIANSIRGSSDYIIKMDTDEFLTLNDKNSKSLKTSLSDYLSDYVTNKNHPLRLLDGEDAKVGYLQQ